MQLERHGHFFRSIEPILDPIQANFIHNFGGERKSMSTKCDYSQKNKKNLVKRHFFEVVGFPLNFQKFEVVVFPSNF